MVQAMAKTRDAGRLFRRDGAACKIADGKAILP